MTINAHPELPEFDYIRPASLEEASRFLVEHSGVSRPLLGGTDIFVRMRDGFWTDKFLVDVKHLDGTDDLRFSAESSSSGPAGLTIGAAVNMNRVMASAEARKYYPVLVEACRSVASYQLRTRATIAGNICNASPAGDTIGACLVLDGMLKIYNLNGWRDVPLSEFFLGPGKTQLQPGDIVTALFLPLPPLKSAGAYIKLGRNAMSDLAIVGVTAFGYQTSAASEYRFRIALASVAPVPFIPTNAEKFLQTQPPGPDAFKEAGELAAESCNPIDDVRGSARYRRAMVKKLTERALQVTWDRLNR